MSRDLTSAVQSEVEKTAVEAFLLAELEFDSNPVYAWNGYGTLTWNATDYTGVGWFGGIEPTKETSELQARGLKFSLSGVPSALLSLALGQDYHNRIARVRLGFFRHEYETDQTVTTAEDSTSNNNDGTLVNDPQWTADEVTDRIVGALSFDGADDTIEVSDSPDFDVGGALTIEAWVYPEKEDAGYRVVQKQNPVGLDQPGFFLVQAADAFNFYFGVAAADNTWDRVGGNHSSFSLNAWNHVAGTYDNAAGEFRLYINANLVGSVDISVGDVGTNSRSLHIGSEDGSSNFIPGKIADARIWNVARTQTEIANNMNKRLTGDETGLVGYWRLDDGVLDVGDIIADPVVLNEGLMDQMVINEGPETSTISVSAESRLIALERPNRFLYDDEGQKALYPNDRGFEFVPALQDKDILWGVGVSAPNFPRVIQDRISPEGGGGR